MNTPDIPTPRACFKCRILHVPNLMQMSENNRFVSFALDSAHATFQTGLMKETIKGVFLSQRHSHERIRHEPVGGLGVSTPANFAH